MKKGPSKASPGRGFYSPKKSTIPLFLSRTIGHFYCWALQGTRGRKIYHMERLYHEMDAYYRGKKGLLILFRHSEEADGPVIITTIAKDLYQWCRKNKKPLPRFPHAHFLYGKDVLNWAGFGARWALPRLGGIPVVNTKVDRQSQDTIKRIVTQGDHPLAFAPEGQVTYHMFRVHPMANGTGRIASWIYRDIKERGGIEGLTILPVSIAYRFPKPALYYSSKLRNLLKRELDAAPALPKRPTDLELQQFLLSSTEVIVSALEKLYGARYLGILKAPQPPTGATGEKGRENGELQERIELLCRKILRTSERALSLSQDGSIIERLFRLRFRIMESYFREDIDLKTLPPMEKNWAHFQAHYIGAHYRNSQIVDVLEYLRPGYITSMLGNSDIQDDDEHQSHPKANTTAVTSRFIEYSLLLMDIINRITGGNIGSRYSPRGKEPHLLIGKPIDAKEIFKNHSRINRSAIETVNSSVLEAFEDLSIELESLVKE
jgi:hypothetical protein